jgi:hypothetical protein
VTSLIKRKRRRKNLEIFNSLFILILLSVITFSCSEENKGVKDFGQIVPKPLRKDTLRINNEIGVDTVKIKFYEKINHLSIDSVVGLSKLLLPDRFNPVKKLKETLYFGKDSLQFCEWKYKDTNNLKQALYNLMDCFESPCKPFKMYESIPVSKSHFSILCNEKTLILIKSSSEIKLNEWLIFLDKEKGYNSFELIISQPKNGKTKWFYSKNTKLTPKTK